LHHNHAERPGFQENDPAVLKGYMDGFEKNKTLHVTPEIWAKAQANMKSASVRNLLASICPVHRYSSSSMQVNEQEVLDTIKNVHRDFNGYAVFQSSRCLREVIVFRFC
jgi:hypothetical protein